LRACGLSRRDVRLFLACLYAGDLDREFAFHSRLFSWTKDRAIDMGAMGAYHTFATGGAPCGAASATLSTAM
jgi:predicted enzyme related to lactoylglutathione lyase